MTHPARPCRRGRDRRNGSGVRRDHQPGRSPPVTGSRSRGEPGQRWPTSSSCSSTPPRSGSRGRPGSSCSSPRQSGARGPRWSTRPGRSVMAGVHPLGDLAPRDVVATAIAMRLREAPGGVDDHVFLDATAHRSRRWSTGSRPSSRGAERRGSTRSASRSRWPRLRTSPAAGSGRRSTGPTTVPGLFAVGEVADTGVHGANRLASNGVTEGLVAGRAVAERLVDRASGQRSRRCPARSSLRRRRRLGRDEPLTRAMSRWVGSAARRRRSARRRARVRSGPAGGRAEPRSPRSRRPTWTTVSRLIVRAAGLREESRGSHRRLDHPETSRRVARADRAAVGRGGAPPLAGEGGGDVRGPAEVHELSASTRELVESARARARPGGLTRRSWPSTRTSPTVRTSPPPRPSPPVSGWRPRSVRARTAWWPGSRWSLATFDMVIGPAGWRLLDHQTDGRPCLAR